MKNLQLFAIGVFATIFASCNIMTKIDPIAYNDSIISEQAIVIKYVDDVLSNDVADSLEVWRVTGVACIENSLGKIDKLGDFKGDNSFRESATNLVNFYKGYMNKDFKEMITLLKKDTAATEEDNARIEEIISNFNNDQDPVYNKFVATQKEFALKNNFTISNK